MLFQLVLALLALAVQAYMPNYIVVTRQDTLGNGYFEQVDAETGMVTASPNISFHFKWPYVQMTTDTIHNIVYALTIPDDGFPRIYRMQSVYNYLAKVGYWAITDGTIIFDLQFSVPHDTLFGIKVTGQYQRTLSNIFLLPNGFLEVHELYNLPEYWYVNASSYDNKRSQYYALLNNFQGLPTSTLDQQLLIADFSQFVVHEDCPAPTGVYVPIIDNVYNGLLQFIGFSEPVANIGVFAAGINKQTNTAYVVLLNSASGEVIDLGFTRTGVTEVGPLVMHSNHGSTTVPMSIFFRFGATWSLYMVEYNTNAKIINVVWHERDYSGEPYQYFAAATVAFNEN